MKKILATMPEGTELTYSVRDLASGLVIDQYQADEMWRLASTSKVFTCDYALQQLGPNFQFKTSLGYKGRIVKGVIKGNLYLQGSKDPTLLTNHLMDMVIELKRRKIKKIEGKLIYPKELGQMISNLGTLDEPYNPNIGILNTNFNRWTFLSEENFPPLPSLVTEESSNRFYYDQRFQLDPSTFEKDNYVERWFYNPSIKNGIKTDAPVRKPHLFSAQSLIYLMKMWGIEIEQVEEAKTYDLKDHWPHPIYEHSSLPLIEICSQALEYSNNLYTEAILLAATKKRTIKEAIDVLMKYLKGKNKLANIELETASGLTYTNQATANSMTQYLANNYLNQYEGGRNFISLLSGNGVNGFMASRMLNTKMFLKSWSKTGTLDYVNNITGILFSSSKRPFGYFVGFYHPKSRKLIEKPLSQRNTAPSLSTSYYKKQGDRAADQLIEYFYDRY
ncbi:MAG: hypothetical protein GY909_13235 [Oligoflexia bacterium]|nr:hypothetical protein [Oligoflexia bacterium]